MPFEHRELGPEPDELCYHELLSEKLSYRNLFLHDPKRRAAGSRLAAWRLCVFAFNARTIPSEQPASTEPFAAEGECPAVRLTRRFRFLTQRRQGAEPQRGIFVLALNAQAVPSEQDASTEPFGGRGRGSQSSFDLEVSFLTQRR